MVIAANNGEHFKLLDRRPNALLLTCLDLNDGVTEVWTIDTKPHAKGYPDIWLEGKRFTFGWYNEPPDTPRVKL